ncbi:MAG: hypothetical protein IJ742_04485 [Prevotella sp.]|nr:hypothetical protein [Prevotella sp.]
MIFFASDDFTKVPPHPYDKVLDLLGTLEIESSSRDIELYFDDLSMSKILNQAKKYSDNLINNKNVFSVRLKQLYDDLSVFPIWTVSVETSVQRNIIWGCVYYVLGLSVDVTTLNLSLIDKLVSKDKKSYQYFQYFKNALEDKEDVSKASPTLQRREIEDFIVLEEPEQSLLQKTQRRIVEHYAPSANADKQSDSPLIMSLNAQIKKLQKENGELKARVAELESELAKAKESKDMPLTEKDKEIKMAIEDLLQAKDDQEKFIFKNKKQWWAVFRVLSVYRNYPLQKQAFVTKMIELKVAKVDGKRDLSFESLNKAQESVPKITTCTPSVWSEYKDINDNYKQQYEVADFLMRKLGIMS